MLTFILNHLNLKLQKISFPWFLVCTISGSTTLLQPVFEKQHKTDAAGVNEDLAFVLKSVEKRMYGNDMMMFRAVTA